MPGLGTEELRTEGTAVPSRWGRIAAPLRTIFGRALDVALPTLCPSCREPVDGNGLKDPGRETQYVGEMQVMSNMGALPISFVIEAKSLEDAAKNYGPAAKAAMERTMRELQELRRQQASSIVVPQGGLPPMGPGGGGKIQMP